jgi:hypothetical protein
MLISTVLFAQKLAVTDVPAQVSTDLKTRFPAAEKAIWEKDNAIYKVNFINDGSKMEITYQNTTWQYTKWIMGIEYVPQKIKDYVAQYYTGDKVIALSFLDKSSGERVYEVEIAKKKKDIKKLIFDSSNNFLRIDEAVLKTN